MTTYRIAVEAVSTAYYTIVAGSEAEAVAEARVVWGESDLQEAELTRVLVERTPGVLTEAD